MFELARLRLNVTILVAVFSASSLLENCRGHEVSLISDVELQPLVAQVKRVAEALELTGAPLSREQRAALDAANASAKPAEAVEAIQKVLDPLCLAEVEINAESRVAVESGGAPKQLVEQGWRAFLIKVHNEAGVTAPLRVSSPNAQSLHDAGRQDPEPPTTITKSDVVERWLDISLFDRQPLDERLSGLKVEYRVLELFSRDHGKREAKLAFDVGQGTQELGFRNEVNLLFDCRACATVKLEVLDDDGTPTTGQFIFRDERGRVYPARSKRMAPDFAFQDQVYRANGEDIKLPPGKYRVTYTRGPEYKVLERDMVVSSAEEHTERFQLERWINLAAKGWISGDHHIHAAGCAHYSSPTQGCQPADMMRHIVGEDLDVGCMLTWGPCWYYQKQFFQGHESELSTPHNVARYDVEVSGFPSSHCGHLVLLRLKNDDYPGTKRIEEWPSWNLPILQWARGQGGIAGYAHSGWGLWVPATSLPTFDVPWYDGIGANEYIVDVTHGACDFISAVDTPFVWEMNIWYHTLNCGFTTRISGETDFPCIYDDRVGLGRVYVKMPIGEKLDYDHWVEGVRDGRSYCSDGITHLFDFEINGLGVGEKGDGGRCGFLAAKKGESLAIHCKAAALLKPEPESSDILTRSLGEKPYWSIERARIKDTRQVPVELIVNGYAVDRQLIDADGQVQDLEFKFTPEQSSWVALRVFPAAHTNPIFVELDGKPIRTSKRSAKWCLEGVDRCWASKSPIIRKAELPAAREAYDHAREVYRQVLAESYDDLEAAKKDAAKPAASSSNSGK